MASDNYARKNVNDGKVTSKASSHPVGTTLGTVGGMAAGVGGAVVTGAAVGSAAGPVGGAVGAVIGGAVGAGAGHKIAAQINPKAEDLFWRENYSSRPYVVAGDEYEAYQPAYRYGVETYRKSPNRSFDDIEPTLSEDWYTLRGSSKLDWDTARHATRDAYERLSNR